MSSSAATAAPALLEEGRAGGSAGLPTAIPGLMRKSVPLGLSQLQGVLKLAHSQEVADQQQAAIELASLIEKAPLPALSFAPVAHALCKLLPSDNRTTVFYAARAAKLLVLDDALRGQTVAVGLPRVLTRSLRTWEEEVPCLRELLGAVQTLTSDKTTVKAVLGVGKPKQGKTIPSAEEREEGAAAVEEGGEGVDALGTILALLEARDGELKTLAIATVANMCAYSDTMLLTHRPFLEGMREQGLPVLLQTVQSQEKLLRCYGMAALANATLHPILAGRLRTLGGVAVIEQVEREHDKATRGGLGGTRVLECAEAALARLGEEGGANGTAGRGAAPTAAAAAAAAAAAGPGAALGLGPRRWTFKWGNQPALELTIDSSKGRYGAVGCLLVWIACFLLVLRPAFQAGGGSIVPGM